VGPGAPELGIKISGSLGVCMSGDLFFIKDFLRLWAVGDAYWIVKLAFHPEMAKLFIAQGGKHGAA
jgi:hypothetical protein